MKNKNIFDGSAKNYLMTCNGLTCGFNMPEALEGERLNKLPPYVKRMPFLVDEYPSCPENWMRSEGRIKSYFVPVQEGKGMWLDFNDNIYGNHHVAIVISIQGINPITGLPCKDAQLEQYIDECPKHKIKFGPDRYCKKCGFKWPKQNYISTTATPTGNFWLDGFRSAEGIVRQYILTAEKMRGVASNIIGKDRVYAIGISFFLSKEKKPSQQRDTRSVDVNSPCFLTATTWDMSMSTGTPGMTDSSMHDVYSVPMDWGHQKSLGGGGTGTTAKDNIASNFVQCSSAKAQPQKFFSPINAPINWQASEKSYTANDVLRCRSISTKKLEVGAGAKIDQQVYDDPEKLDYWHDTPEAIICVNYVDEKDAIKIIESGHKPIESHPEGFLQNVPVGN